MPLTLLERNLKSPGSNEPAIRQTPRNVLAHMSQESANDLFKKEIYTVTSREASRALV